MAWSRTYLQVHWLLDVLAGSLLGAGVALVVFAALQLREMTTKNPADPSHASQGPGATKTHQHARADRPATEPRSTSPG